MCSKYKFAWHSSGFWFYLTPMQPCPRWENDIAGRDMTAKFFLDPISLALTSDHVPMPMSYSSTVADKLVGEGD